MRRRGAQVEEAARPACREWVAQNNSTALQRTLDENVEELLWLAEVLAGGRAAGEQCLAEAIELAEAAEYVGHEWMFSWLKRLMVHVALKRISGEIREQLAAAGARSKLQARGAELSRPDRRGLRSIPPQAIIASLDVLERTCFVLFVYLQYPALDCALLLGCPRSWIESVCESVLTKIADAEEPTPNRFRGLAPFISAGVSECAG